MDEVAGGQIQDLLAIQLWIEVEVIGFQGLGGVDRCASDTSGQLFLVTAGDLVFEQAHQKLGVGPLSIDSLCIAHIQRFQDAGETQAFELEDELRVLVHRTAPKRCPINSTAARAKVCATGAAVVPGKAS